MKRVFILTALLGAAIAASAQKYEIGLNGGIGFNTAPNITTGNYSSFANDKGSDISFVASLKGIYNHKKWQYGVELDERQLSYHWNPIFIQNAGKYVNHPYISKVAFPFEVFVNRKITIKKLETYAGMSVGYWLATKCEDAAALNEVFYDHINGNGFSIGLRGGGTYRLTKRIGLNAEANADFLKLTVGAASYRLFDFPVTLGVRYKL